MIIHAPKSTSQDERGNTFVPNSLGFSFHLLNLLKIIIAKLKTLLVMVVYLELDY